MKITDSVVKNIAELTKLRFTDDELAEIGASMTEILELLEQMQQVNTHGVIPVAHPLDATQPLRPDIVTEENKRAIYQSIAPETQDGLYLVPKVIE